MIMIKRLSHAWTLALSVLSLCALSSCDSAKKTNYLQDIEIAKAYGVKHDTGIVVQKGDKLRILVTSIRNPELTVPFNTRQVAPATAPTTVVGGVSLNTANVAPADTSSSYLVDAQGNIQFPIIGDIPVLGLSLEQVSEVIRTKLTAGRYLTDAQVISKFANLRVFLLGAFEGLGQGGGGAISDRGSFHLDNAQMNILELIATVGGLSEQADFSKINVVRRMGNEYVYYRLDMLSKNIFESPAFYLQQNDIIYAEYRYRKRDTEQKVLTTLGYVTTALSTALSAAALIALFKR